MCTMLPRTLLSLFAKIFERILYMIVQQEMGMYSFIVSASFVLGIRTTRVQFTTLYNFSFPKNSCTALFTSLLTTFQALLKNLAPYPSIPGDFKSLCYSQLYQSPSLAHSHSGTPFEHLSVGDHFSRLPHQYLSCCFEQSLSALCKTPGS